MSCCPNTAEPKDSSSCHSSSKKDYFFYSLILLAFLLYGAHLLNHLELHRHGKVWEMAHHYFVLINKMSWGILAGILFAGVLGHIPREYILTVIGTPGKTSGLVRATLAGVFLDLCSHGILVIGIKLYKRGAGLGQVMAFLIASPWNSLSLTVILISLIGLKWTLLFIILSAVIAFISGHIFDQLEKKKILPANPNSKHIDPDFKFWQQLRVDLSKTKFSLSLAQKIIVSGIKDSKIIIKWVLFGALLSSLINGFINEQWFRQYFGPDLIGMGMTLVFATIIEVCSEGATPIAADLFTKGSAPGNSFTFLMAGVSTDYTEIMTLKESMKSWKIALFLPLVTLPQIIIIGLILNS